MKFAYTGVNRKGERTSGTLDANNEEEVKKLLRTLQIRPTKLSKSTESKSGVSFGGGKKLNLKGMIAFTRQLSSLIDAGIPIVQGLEILIQQEKKPFFKDILNAIKENIEGGATLAESLARHPKIFTEMIVRLVEAGEVSGTLDITLRRVGVQLEKLSKIKAKVGKALLMPAITIVAAFGVLIFLLVKVIPEVAKMYGESNAELPAPTLIVLAISEWLQNNITFILGGMVFSAFGFSYLYKKQSFREKWDPFILKIPLFGYLTISSAVATFSRTLSTLMTSGVPVINALEMCKNIMSNLAIRNVLDNTVNAITEGKTISFALQASKIFPPMLVQMVQIGESTGKLDELMSKLADIYEEEVDNAIEMLTGLLQPALIVGIGALIAFLLVSMYLPIFQLAEKASAG